jgi:hypothetical protein
MQDFHFLIKDIRELFAILAAMVGFATLATVASCTHEQQAQVKTVLAAADSGSKKGCVLFEQLQIDQDHIEDVCLGADVVREAIADYKKRHPTNLATSASASAAPPPASASAAPGVK